MLKKKTVLVLGAGSSFEFGLPAGEGLAAAIASAVNFQSDGLAITHGDRTIWGVATDRGNRDVEAVFAAGQLVSRTLPLARSIDALLYNHGHNAHAVRLGKLGIAACILRAERGSRLMWNRDQDPSAALHAIAPSWLYKLFRFLWTGVRLDELETIFERLSIINFNYDRCVEHFLARAIEIAYDTSEARAQELIATLDIVHPYGQVGRLPWQRGSGAEASFGAEHFDLGRVADGIKTFTEQAHDLAEVENWRERLRQADQIVFLGFAFHPQNMELLDLGPDQNGAPWARTYATVYQMPGPELDLVRERIHGARGRPPVGYPEPVLLGATCADFVDQYGAVLAG